MGRMKGSLHKEDNCLWTIIRSNGETAEHYCDDQRRSWNDFLETGQVDDWRWNSEDFGGIYLFRQKEDAEQALMLYRIQMNRLRCMGKGDAISGYKFSIGKVLDTNGYNTVLEWMDNGDLPEETIDGAVALFQEGAKREAVLKKYGNRITATTASAIRSRYTLFVNAGFGRFYFPNRKERR